MFRMSENFFAEAETSEPRNVETFRAEAVQLQGLRQGLRSQAVAGFASRLGPQPR